MCVYWFPFEIIQKIHSVMTFFWWENGSKKKIHWKVWDSLCMPKCLGCSRFCDLSIFKEALLQRHAWWLINMKIHC